jgi:hypothetical protein
MTALFLRWLREMEIRETGRADPRRQIVQLAGPTGRNSCEDPATADKHTASDQLLDTIEP